jgi:transglutaminase-like putative cysteine protease
MTVDSVASRYVSIGDVDTYNGDSWSFSRTFRPSGGVVPANTDPSLRPKGRPIDQQYTLVGNAGRNPFTSHPWMPFEFRPQQIIGVSVDTDPGSGMIVPSSSLRVGKPYSVTSSVPLRTLDQLRAKAQAGTSYQPEDLQLPTQVQASLQPVIRAFHRETGTTGATPPVTFLQALSADLRARYGLLSAGGSAQRSRPVSSPSSPSAQPSNHPSSPAPGAGTASSRSQAAGAQPGGTSFAVVLASILRSQTATPEQYATLVALIARQLGVPAVVVTGFRLPTRGGASTVQPGTYTVTTGDAWSWVAIPIQRHGWVVLDPTPMTPRERKVLTPGGSRRLHSTRSPQATLQTVTPGRAGHAVAPTAKPSRSHPVAIGVVVAVVLAAIAALIVVALIVVMLRKRLRMRRRRGAADPRLRVVGAWQETLDVLVESGLSDTHALTNAEIAAATAEAFGPEPGKQAQFLGSRANLAIFSPATRIGTGDADAAWGAHTALRRAVRSQLPLKKRLTSQVRYPRQPRETVVGPASWDAATRARGDMPYFPRHRARRRRGIHRLRAH